MTKKEVIPSGTVIDIYPKPWPACSCGAASAWLYEPGHTNSPEKDYCCDACVPRGCSCMTNELYEAMSVATENDTLVMPNMMPEFDPQLHGRRDAEGNILPCCEWYHIDTTTTVV